MPVLSKANLQNITDHLSERYIKLRELMRPRDLSSPREGAGKGHWVSPEKMAATVGDALELRMAVEDFKTILDEIKKLK